MLLFHILYLLKALPFNLLQDIVLEVTRTSSLFFLIQIIKTSSIKSFMSENLDFAWVFFSTMFIPTLNSCTSVGCSCRFVRYCCASILSTSL